MTFCNSLQIAGFSVYSEDRNGKLFLVSEVHTLRAYVISVLEKMYKEWNFCFLSNLRDSVPRKSGTIPAGMKSVCSSRKIQIFSE